MNKIVLISCVSKKLPYLAKAQDLYISPLFKMNLRFAKQLSPNKIFILSAKYGLVDLNKKIEPYNCTLNDIKIGERKDWAKRVLQKLTKVSSLESDEFIILAGEKYREYLINKIKNYKIPLKGLSIGKQLQYLKRATNE